MNDLALGGEREALDSLPGHVVAAFDFAIGLWPQSLAPGSTAVRIAWAPALTRYSYAQLCEALDRLALTGDFPSKHDLVSLLREMFPPAEVPRLSPPAGEPGTMREGVRMWRDSELRDLEDRAALGLDEAGVAAERAGFMARARALFPQHADLFDRPDTERAAVELCDRRARGEVIDVEALDPEVRAAARVEWVRRHPRAVAS